MIENHMPGNLYNELFSESSEEICTAFQSMLGPLLFIKILLKTGHLLYKHFPPGLPLFASFISVFYKGKDTSTIPQPGVYHLVFVFLYHFSPSFLIALRTST